MTSWDGMWVSCPRKAAKMARQQLQKVSKFEHHVLYKPGFWGILSINIMFRGSYNNLWRRSDGVIFSEVLLLPASWLLLPWSVCGIERSETRKFLHPKLTSFPSKHLPGRVIRIKKHLMLPCQAMERSRHYRKARLLVGKQPGKKSLHSDKGDPEGMFCSWIFMVGTNTYIYIHIYANMKSDQMWPGGTREISKFRSCPTSGWWTCQRVNVYWWDQPPAVWRVQLGDYVTSIEQQLPRA